MKFAFPVLLCLLMACQPEKKAEINPFFPEDGFVVADYQKKLLGERHTRDSLSSAPEKEIPPPPPSNAIPVVRDYFMYNFHFVIVDEEHAFYSYKKPEFTCGTLSKIDSAFFVNRIKIRLYEMQFKAIKCGEIAPLLFENKQLFNKRHPSGVSIAICKTKLNGGLMHQLSKSMNELKCFYAIRKANELEKKKLDLR